LLKEVREHLDFSKEFEDVISDEDIAKRRIVPGAASGTIIVV
jgi:hypothetical protein